MRSRGYQTAWVYRMLAQSHYILRYKHVFTRGVLSDVIGGNELDVGVIGV